MTQPNTLMGLLSDLSWPLEALVALQSDTLNIRASLVDLTNQLNRIEGKVDAMAVSVDQLDNDLNALATGFAALQATNAAQAAQITDLQNQLAAAGVAQQAAVDAAVQAEDTDAQAKIDAADAIAQGILNPPAPPAPPAA